MRQTTASVQTLGVHDGLSGPVHTPNATLDLQGSERSDALVVVSWSKPANPTRDLDETLEGHVEFLRASSRLERLYAYLSPEQPPAVTPLQDPKLAGIAWEFEQLAIGAEEGGWTRPTEYSHRKALRFLTAAYTLTKLEDPDSYCRIPDPLLTTDSLGGVRVAWRTLDREIRANIGAEPGLRTYLYFERGREHGAEELDARTISIRLRWLLAS